MSALISGNYSVLRVLESFWRSCWDEFRNLSFGELAIYSLMCIIVVHLIFFIRARLTGKTVYFYQELLWIALVTYIFFIIYITVLIRVDGSSGRVFSTAHLKIQDSLDQNMSNLLNLFLFMPLGVLFALVMEKKLWMVRILMTGVYSFLISIAIETVQYITARGYFELDDIEVNVLGGIIGAGIICMLGYFVDMNKKVDV